jgi:hypothetical protein
MEARALKWIALWAEEIGGEKEDAKEDSGKKEES